MSGNHEVIELLSSSDESSSSDSRPRRAQQSPSSEEEEKQQRKPPKRRLVRASHGVRISSTRRRKRVAFSESESSHASDSSEEERSLLKQLKKPRAAPPALKRTRVAATSDYVAKTTRTRPDRRADGEMRQITEGMNFSELQAQEQMMARFQNQNRRKGSAKQHAEAAPVKKAAVVRAFNGSDRRAPTDARHLAKKTSSSESQAQDRAMAQFHMQKARKSAPAAPTRRSDSESEEDGESEEKDEEWEEFTRKSAIREAARKNMGVGKQSADTRRQDRASPSTLTISSSRRPVDKQQGPRKSEFFSKRPKEHKTVKRSTGKTKRRVVLGKFRSSSEEESEEESEKESEEENQEEIARRRKQAPKSSKPKQRAAPRKSRSSSSEREFEFQDESELESEDDEVVIVDPPEPKRHEKPKARKPKAPKQPEVSTKSSKRQSDSPPPVADPPEGAAQVPLRAAPHRRSENIAEKMSIEELQAQEKALQFFHAQKRRNNAGSSSTGRKGTHGTNGGSGANEENGAHSSSGSKSSGSGRRARMEVSQKATPDTSASLSFVVPPSRNGISTVNTQSVSRAGATATEEKAANPVVHSTAWRRLVFDEAPPNILHAVSAIPYSPGFDKPLWEYDPTGKLKKKCRFVASLGQGVAITEDNFENQSPVQTDVDRQVSELMEKELPSIKECHANRVASVLKETRTQLKEYLKAHQVLRGELYRRLQWSEIANHQAWLDVSPIERVTAKRMAQNAPHTAQPYNSLVGDVRYIVYRDQAALASWVIPETVTHLSNDITALRRSFTMIGVRKNAYVKDDPILRYVPYLGDGERMVIDNVLYKGTTMSKERRVAVFGKGDELKVLNPGAGDDEVTEYLLRVIVAKCGGSEQVFLALQHVAGFDRPRVDYVDMMKLNGKEKRAARRVAQTRKMMLDSPSEAPHVSKVLQELAQSHWFLRGSSEPQSLAQRLQSPVSAFEASYAECPEALGIRDRETYEGLIEWHRDLFCRRCYTYDCWEHGIQNPQRCYRADPIYPMVTAPGIVLARQEAPELDSAENSSASPTEVIELSSSSSGDEDQESKKEADAVEQSSAHPVAAYRRSRRAQTQISSLASKSLETQEKMLETERQAQLEKRRKRREKFERAADNSEYLDNSYVPAITATLQKLVPKSQPCGASCWLSSGDLEAGKDVTLLSGVDAVLVRKLALTFGPNACVVSSMIKSPRCTCAQIAKFLAVEKKRRDSGDDLMPENGSSTPAETRRKGRRQGGRMASNRSLAQRVGSRARSYDREKKLSYKPCNHDGVCDEKCECTSRGTSCNKACPCPRDCPNRFQGCKCSTGNCHTSACPCWNAGRECEPDYCFSCGASDAAVMAFHAAFKCRSSYDLHICLNVNMLRGSIQKKVGVAFSATHGWGAYALEPIRKDEFVLEYTGELISDEEADRRGAIYDRQSVSYLFGVNSEYVVDAARKGNKAKFANHREKDAANLDVRIVASNGEHRIGLFAREAIEVGAELFFDYGYTHATAPKWSQHGRQQPEQKRYEIVDDEDNEWEKWESD